MKYLITDDKEKPLAIREGTAGVQQYIEQTINLVDPSDKSSLNCLEDFRIYEIGNKKAIVVSLIAMAD